jgi:hypothetical protein
MIMSAHKESFMLNIIRNTAPESLSDVPSLEGLFSVEVLKEVSRFRSGELDLLIVRGMPVSDNLPPTPSEIRAPIYPEQEKAILTTVAQSLGNISAKEVEHTIRFNLEGEGTNNETWHSHFQYKSSIFFCVRADANAMVYFLTASEVIESAGELTPYLTTPYQFLENLPAFSLIESREGYYIFSKYIFERSELEKYVKDLDLPDAMKMLRIIVGSASDQNFARAASYLLNKLEKAQDCISYVPGDLIMVHEPRVIRYSPGYRTDIAAKEARWLLAVSLEH